MTLSLQDPKDAHDKTMFHCERLAGSWTGIKKLRQKEAHADSVRRNDGAKNSENDHFPRQREWGNYCCDPSEMVW